MTFSNSTNRFAKYRRLAFLLSILFLLSSGNLICFADDDFLNGYQFLEVQPDNDKNKQSSSNTSGRNKQQNLPSVSKRANDSRNFSPVSLSGQDEDENKAKFEGDNVNYDPETGSFIIEGAATLYLRKQGIKLAADRIEYIPSESRLKAFGNVLITGNDQVTFSKDLDLNIEDNSALLGNVKSEVTTASIEALKASLKSTPSYRTATYTKGTFQLDTPIALGSRGGAAQSYRLNESRNSDPKRILADGQSFTMQANNLTYYPDRIQNNLFVSGAKIKFKKAPITLPLPFAVLTAGDSSQQMFGLVAGNSPRTGAGDFNIGPKISLVLGDPKKKRAISAAPFLQFGSRTGYGGMLQYTDPNNRALIAYGAAKNRPLAELSSRFTSHNSFVYGWNSYLGGGITKQFIQLNDRREIKLPILGALLEGNSVNSFADLSFITDSQELRNRENNILSRLQRDSLGGSGIQKDKSALRAQQTLFFSSKPLIELGSEKYNTGVRIISSSTVRAYTTGDLNAFTSLGPNLRVHANRFTDFELGYNQLFPVGSSPFGVDQVIQGQRSAYANGDVNLTKWLTIGGYGVYSLSRSTFVSQQFRIVFGPEDFKLLIGFDRVRRQVNFGFNILFSDKVGFNKFSYQKNTSGRKRRF